MQRRRLVMLLAALPLAGCGFHLRGAPDFAFRSLYVPATSSSLSKSLIRTLQGTGGQLEVITDAARMTQAEAVLELYGEQRDRVVVGMTTAGQVRELQLRLRVRFRVRGQKGQEWIADTGLSQTRDVSYNESISLAKESEEALLNRDMETDIVQQIVRRLAAVRAPALS